MAPRPPSPDAVDRRGERALPGGETGARDRSDEALYLSREELRASALPDVVEVTGT